MQSFPQFDPVPEKNLVNSTQSLFSLSLQQLEKLTETLGLERYRSRQLWHALYQQRVSSLEEMTALPRSMRELLGRSGFQVGMPRIAQAFVSTDGTERYLVACADGETVETVWMPNGDDGELGDGSEAADEESRQPGAAEPAPSFSKALESETWVSRRATICISSQVGCAVNCQFCLTAKLGVKRNLTAGEIAGQVASGVESPPGAGWPGSHQPGIYGDGRTVPELRQFYCGRALAG